MWTLIGVIAIIIYFLFIDLMILLKSPEPGGIYLGKRVYEDAYEGLSNWILSSIFVQLAIGIIGLIAAIILNHYLVIAALILTALSGLTGYNVANKKWGLFRRLKKEDPKK